MPLKEIYNRIYHRFFSKESRPHVEEGESALSMIKPNRLIPILLIYFLIIFFMLITTDSFGQTGPGGVGNQGGTSELILWLDANQITGITNSNNITTWEDKSGYDNHASQSNTNSKPNYFENTLNGFPVLNFNGTEDLDGNFGGAFNADATIFAVAIFDNDQGTTDDDHVFSVGKQIVDGRMVSVSRSRDSGGNQNKYYCEDGDSDNYGPVLTTSQWYIFSQIMTTSSPELNLYVDGTSQTVDDFYGTGMNTNGEYSVGNWSDSPNSQYLLDGQIAEIIVLSDDATVVERKLIESYLSAKYAIAIDAGSDMYAGDDPGNSDFDRDVMGIGRESGDSHDNSQSKGLSISQDSGFGDGDYIMVGHKVVTNTVNTVDASDAGATLEARWDRQWYLDYTDPDNSTRVDITFDFNKADFGNLASGTPSNYKILYRSSTAGNWTLLANVPSITGDEVTFSSVDLSINGSGYYTLGTIDATNSPVGTEKSFLANEGPGGIGDIDGSSNLELWLIADQIDGQTGDPIITWADQSGNGNDCSKSILNFPTVVNSSLNGKNSVSFDGSGDFFEGTISGGLNPLSTIVTLVYFDEDQGSDNDYVVSIGASASPGDHTSIARRLMGSNTDQYYAWDGNIAVHTTDSDIIATDTWTIISQTIGNVGDRHKAFLDGKSIGVDPYGQNLNSNGDYNVGRWVGGTANSFLEGDIAEIIVFSDTLSEPELNIMHSYLAAKYDLTVTGDKYVGDDVGNGDHDMDVAGVGTDAGDDKLSGSSAGMQITQNMGFEDGDYVMFGHKTETNSTTNMDIDDAGSSLVARWERTWWVDITDASTALSVDIVFDFSSAEAGSVFPNGTASNYKLIFRTGTSGNWTLLADASSYSADQITFTNVAITTDGYYGLATASTGSVLPVELVSFESKIEDQSVVLEWTTVSELNNDRFEIYKSIDGSDFEMMGSVKGNGTTQEKLDYSFEDLNPQPGVNYYMLKQIDYDGKFEMSKTITAFFEASEDALIYPNPVKNELRVIPGNKYIRTNTLVSILELSGKVVKSEMVLLDETRVIFLTQDLPNGMYILRLENDNYDSKIRFVVSN